MGRRCRACTRSGARKSGSATAAGWRIVETAGETYDALGADELVDVARRYFGASAWTAGWSLPESARGEVAFARRRAAGGAQRA